MTLEEIVQKAEEQFDCRVEVAVDCGDKWALCFEQDEECLGMIPAFVLKNGAGCEFFFLEDFVGLLNNGRVIELFN